MSRNGHAGTVDLAALMRQQKGIPAVTDPRMTHIKIVRFAAQFLVAWALSGRALKLDGFPEGAEMIGVRQYQINHPQGIEAGVEVLLYHPDFPVVLAGVNPPVIALNVIPVDAEPVPAEEPDADAD